MSFAIADNLLFMSFSLWLVILNSDLTFPNPKDVFLSILKNAFHRYISDIATNMIIAIKLLLNSGDPKASQIAMPNIIRIKIQNAIESINFIYSPVEKI